MADRPLYRLLQQGGVYALGNIAVKASGLLLAPIFLNSKFLPVSDYGYLSLLLITSQILIFMIGLGLGIGMLKFGTDASLKSYHESLPFTVLVTTIGITLMGGFVLWNAADWIAGWLLDGREREWIVRWMVLYVSFKVVAAIPMMLLRMHERAGYYALMMAVEMLALVVGVYVFVAQNGQGLEGVMRGYAMASLLTMSLLLAGTLSRISWTFKPRVVGSLIQYSTPLVFMSFASLILNAGDRYVLKVLADTSVLGLYEWGVRISGILNMLVIQSFQLAFTVIGLKELGTGRKDLHRDVFKHFCVWVGWAVLGLSLLAYDLTLLLVYFGADEVYLEAHTLVFPLALGFMVYGLYVVIVNVLYAEWKTRVISIIVVFAAAFNIGLNIILIPYLGAYGAAGATLLSYGLLAGIAVWRAEAHIKMKYPWGIFIRVVLIVVLLFALGMVSQHWEVWARVLSRLVLIACYIPIIFLLRLYSVNEIRTFVRNMLPG